MGIKYRKRVMRRDRRAKREKQEQMKGSMVRVSRKMKSRDRREGKRKN